MEKLKPCPFCGSTNVKRIIDFSVECAYCGAQAGSPEMWNTRKPIEQLKQKFRKMMDHWNSEAHPHMVEYANGQLDAWEEAIDLLEELWKN